MATRHALDVPVLFNQYGLADIWSEEYKKVGVKWLSAAGQDPCNFNTKKPIKSLEDLDGLRLYTFPTAGAFLTRFGVVPVNIPYEDAEVAVQTGELDGMAWSGITEDYTVGWADVTDYFTSNNISGAWIGSFFINEKAWADLPEHLQALALAAVESGHHYRNQWYWGGEASLRAKGDKLELTYKMELIVTCIGTIHILKSIVYLVSPLTQTRYCASVRIAEICNWSNALLRL